MRTKSATRNAIFCALSLAALTLFSANRAEASFLDWIGAEKSIADFRNALDGLIQQGFARLDGLLDEHTKAAFDRFMIGVQTFSNEVNLLQADTFAKLGEQREAAARDLATLADELEKSFSGEVANVRSAMDKWGATVRNGVLFPAGEPVMIGYSPAEFLTSGEAPLSIWIDGINFAGNGHTLKIGVINASLESADDDSVVFTVPKKNLDSGAYGLVYGEVTLIPRSSRVKAQTYQIAIKPLITEIGTFELHVKRLIGRGGEEIVKQYEVSWTTEETDWNALKPVASRRHRDCSTIVPEQGFVIQSVEPRQHYRSFVETGRVAHLYVRGRPVRNNTPNIYRLGTDLGGINLESTVRISKPRRAWSRYNNDVGSVVIVDTATTRVCIDFIANRIPVEPLLGRAEYRQWPFMRRMKAIYDVRLRRVADEKSAEVIALSESEKKLYPGRDAIIRMDADITSVFAVITFKDTGESRILKPDEKERGIRFRWTENERVATFETNADEERLN